MASIGYDAYGKPIIIHGGQRAPRYRARHASDVPSGHQIYQDDDGYFYTPEPEHRRHHRANSTNGMRPAQIIINNENNVIEDHPQEMYEPAPPPPRVQYIQQPQPQYIQQPQTTYIQQPPPRVYVQDQQIVQVNRGKSPTELSYQTRRALDDLEKMKRDKEQEDFRKQVQHDLELKAAKAHEDELKRIEEEKELKKKAVEEWQAEQEKKEREKKEKEEEREKIGQEYMRQQLRRDGWTEEEIDEAIKAKDKKRASSPSITSTSIVIANRPQNFVKVHKKHIDPQTLDAYQIEWAWAEDGYINIYRSLTEADQDILFEHTRKLKEKKLIKFAEVETTTVTTKGIDRDRHGRLVVVRKKDARSKSPAGKKKTFFLN